MVYGIVLPTLVIKIDLIWRSHGIKNTLFIGSSWDRVAIMGHIMESKKTYFMGYTSNKKRDLALSDMG